MPLTEFGQNRTISDEKFHISGVFIHIFIALLVLFISTVIWGVVGLSSDFIYFYNVSSGA